MQLHFGPVQEEVWRILDNLGGDDILPRMDKVQLYGYVACAVGVAALITGLLPQDKMDKVRAFMHKNFGKEGQKDDNRVSPRVQLIIFGVFFLFIGLVISGLIHLGPSIASKK